jgi:hypothetical protein
MGYLTKGEEARMTKRNEAVQSGFDSCGFHQLPNVGRQFVSQSLLPSNASADRFRLSCREPGTIWKSASPGNRHRLKNIGHVDRDRGDPSLRASRKAAPQDQLIDRVVLCFVISRYFDADGARSLFFITRSPLI